MAQIEVRGVRIEFETRGPETAPAFLLIRGLSTQLVHWPELLLDTLVDAGFRVVVFDNRDCGLSEKFDAAGAPSIRDLLAEKAAPAYTIADMAIDAVGVLDALGIDRAHAAGISLGGMIAQHLAISHGARFRTVTSIMSSSGAPGLPAGRPEAMAALSAQPSDPDDRETVIRHQMKTQRLIGSPGYPMTEAELRSYCERGYDRCYCPAGTARQMAAVLTDGSRADRLARIEMPFQVIHGREDPLIPLACGEDTAARVPGAPLVVIEGLGHDVTIANTPRLTEPLIAFAKQHRD